MNSPDGRSETRITRATIEEKLRDLRGDVEATAEAAKPMAMAAAVVIGVVVLGAVYLLGRRRGRKRNTFVEIRRV